MKAKNYQFFETYFNSLKSNLNPEHAAIALVKAFIFPLLGLFMATFVAVTVSNKNYTLDTFIGMLIILGLFILIYFSVYNVGFMKKVMRGNLDHTNNSELSESKFNMMVNMLLSSSDVIRRKRGTDKLDEIDKVYIYEALQYLLEVGNNFNDSIENQNNGGTSINNERYFALLNFYFKLVLEMEKLLTEYKLKSTYLNDIKTFYKNIKAHMSESIKFVH